MNSEKNFSHLVLVRHGQSEWNAKNLFTGWKNPSLTEKGFEEAKITGEKIKKQNIVIDIRSQKEFDEGKISQARHVGPDLEVCKKEIAKADENPVILVCQNGTNSSRMASDLKKEQISVFVLKGGINNWISEKLPLVN